MKQLADNTLRRAAWVTAVLIVASAFAAGPVAMAGEPIRFVRPKDGEKPPLRVNFAAEKARATETPTASSISQAAQSGASAGYNIRKSRTARKNWDTESSDAPKEELVSPQPRAIQSVSGDERVENPSGSVFGGSPGINPGSNPNEQRSALRSISQGTFGDRNPSAFGGSAPSMGNSARPSGPGQVGFAPSRSALEPVAANRPGSGPGLGIGTPAPPPRAASPYDPANRPLHSSFDPPPRPR